MPNPGKKRTTGCPVAFGLDTFGDRWSLIIIRDLLLFGKNTYGEFLGAAENIATNVLADRLRDLEADGIVAKSRDPQNRRRYIYSLTEKGLDLAPIVLEIVQWSGKHDPNTIAHKDILARIKQDRESFLADIRARLTGEKPQPD